MKSIGVDWITVNELLDFRGKTLPEEAVIDNWSCQYPFQRITISSNGTIFPCTGAHNEEEDLILGRYRGSKIKKIKKNGNLRLMDFPELSIAETWHCQKLKKIRTLHKNNERRKILTCKYCRHGAQKHGVQWIPEDWDMGKMQWSNKSWRS
jgi:hypothetical protein